MVNFLTSLAWGIISAMVADMVVGTALLAIFDTSQELVGFFSGHIWAIVIANVCLILFFVLPKKKEKEKGKKKEESFFPLDFLAGVLGSIPGVLVLCVVEAFILVFVLALNDLFNNRQGEDTIFVVAVAIPLIVMFFMGIASGILDNKIGALGSALIMFLAFGVAIWGGAWILVRLDGALVGVLFEKASPSVIWIVAGIIQGVIVLYSVFGAIVQSFDKKPKCDYYKADF